MQTNGSMFVVWCTSTLEAKHITIILKSWVYYTMMHVCMQAGCVQVNLLHKLCISTCELHDFVLFGMSRVIHWRLCWSRTIPACQTTCLYSQLSTIYFAALPSEEVIRELISMVWRLDYVDLSEVPQKVCDAFCTFMLLRQGCLLPTAWYCWINFKE